MNDQLYRESLDSFDHVITSIKDSLENYKRGAKKVSHNYINRQRELIEALQAHRDIHQQYFDFISQRLLDAESEVNFWQSMPDEIKSKILDVWKNWHALQSVQQDRIEEDKLLRSILQNWFDEHKEEHVLDMVAKLEQCPYYFDQKSRDILISIADEYYQ